MLASSDGVWNATLVEALDVSSDVVEAVVVCEREGAHVRLDLDNSAGQYTGYGSGGLAVLRLGARLELSPGYVTISGDEINTTRLYAYWVESIEAIGGARPHLVLNCRGSEWLLQRWRARRQYVFAADISPVFGLLFTIVSRAGLPFGSTGNTSAAFSALQPAFTVHPGESGMTALRRLIAKVPDVVFFDAGAVLATEPRSTDTSQYAFGPGGHAIVEGRYRDLGPAVNRARVEGDGVHGEAFDFEDIEAFGESLATVVDGNVDDADDAEDRAEALLREAEIAARGDVIRVFGVHCGVELYDVVDVTDPPAGLTSSARRVIGYRWRYSTTGRPGYDMTLTLGNV
jgi:hypothetical protein